MPTIKYIPRLPGAALSLTICTPVGRVFLNSEGLDMTPSQYEWILSNYSHILLGIEAGDIIVDSPAST
jgi:hypothetical protein